MSDVAHYHVDVGEHLVVDTLQNIVGSIPSRGGDAICVVDEPFSERGYSTNRPLKVEQGDDAL